MALGRDDHSASCRISGWLLDQENETATQDSHGAICKPGIWMIDDKTALYQDQVFWFWQRCCRPTGKRLWLSGCEIHPWVSRRKSVMKLCLQIILTCSGKMCMCIWYILCVLKLHQNKHCQIVTFSYPPTRPLPTTKICTPVANSMESSPLISLSTVRELSCFLLPSGLSRPHDLWGQAHHVV